VEEVRNLPGQSIVQDEKNPKREGENEKKRRIRENKKYRKKNNNSKVGGGGSFSFLPGNVVYSESLKVFRGVQTCRGEELHGHYFLSNSMPFTKFDQPNTQKIKFSLIRCATHTTNMIYPSTAEMRKKSVRLVEDLLLLGAFPNRRHNDRP
jgi:hypothetical protein